MRSIKTLWSKLTQEHQVLSLMLFLGLSMGLIFIFLVPPWQHYDEPTQFEYAWLIANHAGLPGEGQFDQSMRREVAASMIEHDFFQDLGSSPNLLSTAKPIWIGISQIGSQPLYYWLAALPLQFLETADITFQLYVGRFNSLLFYLITIIVAYGVAADLTPNNHPLRWLLPISVLMLPSFVDIMTAANDDVGAVAFFSLFLWAGIRLIVKGFSWLRLFAIIILAAICLFTKNTVTIAILFLPIPILFSIFKGKSRKYVWLTFAICLVVFLASIINLRDAAYWYRVSSQSLSTRSIDSAGHPGDNVFRMNLSPESPGPEITQLLEPSDGASLHDTNFTLGAWIWADIPIRVQTPQLIVNNKRFFEEVEVNTEPKFFSFSGKINASNSPIRLALSPLNLPTKESIAVYYDGIVLVDEKLSNDVSPEFTDGDGKEGIWDGKPFVNLVRNPSAESSWPWIRPWLDNTLLSRFPSKPSLILGFLMDPLPNRIYYQAMLKSLAQTFWAKFGWGHVVLEGYRPYTILAFITLSGCIGAVFAFWRRRERILWDVAFFLGTVAIVVWGSAMVRGLSSILQGSYFIPVARYAYPAIIPTMLLLNLGWLELVRGAEIYLKLPSKVSYLLLVLFFVVLNVISIFSIYRFYYT